MGRTDFPRADRVIQRLAGKTAVPELLDYSSSALIQWAGPTSGREAHGEPTELVAHPPGKLRSGPTQQDCGIRVFVLGAEGV